MEYENDTAMDIMHSMLTLINHSITSAPTLLDEVCSNFNELVDGLNEVLMGDEDEHESKLSKLKVAVAKMVATTKEPWQHRNDKLHGALDIMHDTQYKKLLHKQVRQLLVYSESTIVMAPDQMTDDISICHVDFLE
jgi:ElaB/YqjD/DUF883 family membrane-anchored ribosome-binding protein